MTRARRGSALIFALAAFASGEGISGAQAPVVNARVETQAAQRGLATQIQTIANRGSVVWVGYRVPIMARPRARVSDTGTCCGRCRLEPSADLLVLARFEARALVELRSSGVDCDLDAAGMPLVWLEQVDPAESVAWLSTLLKADTGGSRALWRAALAAVAMHAAPAANATLVELARNGSLVDTRGQALFWLGQRASAQAVAAITEAIDRDPEFEVKKKAVFALSQLGGDEAVTRLLDVARSNRSAAIRGEAMFWLGQTKDPRAVDFFAGILLR